MVSRTTAKCKANRPNDQHRALNRHKHKPGAAYGRTRLVLLMRIYFASTASGSSLAFAAAIFWSSSSSS